MKAKDIMTSEHIWTSGDTADIRRVAQLMAEHDVGAIPVLDQQGKLEGIITDRDICCRVVAKGRSFETPVRQVMTADVHTVSPEASLEEVESMMQRFQIRRVPVVDRQNKLQGIVSQTDLLRAVHGTREEHELLQTLGKISEPK